MVFCFKNSSYLLSEKNVLVIKKSFWNEAEMSRIYNWADDKQSKAWNSDSKYRQMALVGFDT